MTYEESIEQLNNLLRRCGVGFNKADIEVIDFIIKENQELRKQLEERTKMYLNAYKYAQGMGNEVITLKAEQKEFIKYLEDKINFYKINTQGYSMNLIEEILQKYKEIIGVDK